MKKITLLLAIIPMLLVGCSKKDNSSIANSKNVPINETKANSNSSTLESIKIKESNNYVDLKLGYYERLTNNPISVEVNNEYKFNLELYTNYDYDFSRDCYLDGVLKFDNYEVELNKVGIDYYYSGKLNKTSIYIRGDNGKVFYEFRSNTRATLEIKGIFKFIYF